MVSTQYIPFKSTPGIELRHIPIRALSSPLFPKLHISPRRWQGHYASGHGSHKKQKGKIQKWLKNSGDFRHQVLYLYHLQNHAGSYAHFFLPTSLWYLLGLMPIIVSAIYRMQLTTFVNAFASGNTFVSFGVIRQYFTQTRGGNSSRCLLWWLPGLQCSDTPSNSNWHTCHVCGHPSKYYPCPTLLDFGDEMGTGMSNVARRRSQTSQWQLILIYNHRYKIAIKPFLQCQIKLYLLCFC
jgi:hypothetical protein